MSLRIRSVVLSVILAAASFAPPTLAQNAGSHAYGAPSDKTESAYGGRSSKAVTLYKSTLYSGDFNGAVYEQPLEYADVVREKVKCPTDECTVEAVMTVQYSVDDPTSGTGICFEVDKRFKSPGCPELGEMAADTNVGYATKTTTAAVYNLAKGKHKVAVQFISGGGAQLFIYYVKFNVYTR